MTCHISKSKNSAHAHSYGLSFIVMMEAPHLGRSDYLATLTSIDWSWLRRIHHERKMGSPSMVRSDVAGLNPLSSKYSNSLAIGGTFENLPSHFRLHIEPFPSLGKGLSST